jgi:hypothetical protein
MKIKLGGSSRNAGKLGTNKDIGPKDIFEMGSSNKIKDVDGYSAGGY